MAEDATGKCLCAQAARKVLSLDNYRGAPLATHFTFPLVEEKNFNA
jgi:hypothetical protein